MNYEQVIDRAIANARKRGYRIQAHQMFDSYTKTCCPMGAVMMNEVEIPKRFSIIFQTSFDNGVHTLMYVDPTDEDIIAHKLGRVYRSKYIRNAH